MTDSLARDEFPPLPVTIPPFNLAGQKVDLNDKETQKGILTWGKSFINEAKNLGEVLGLDKLGLTRPAGGDASKKDKSAKKDKKDKAKKTKSREEIRDNAKNRWSAPKSK